MTRRNPAPPSRPTQSWRCKACGVSGEVPGTLKTQVDVLITRIVQAHHASATSVCPARGPFLLGWDLNGWFMEEDTRAAAAKTGRKRRTDPSKATVDTDRAISLDRKLPARPKRARAVAVPA